MLPSVRTVRTSKIKIGARRGFTLIEVLVSMGVLAFGVVGFAALRTKSLNNATTATNYAQAISLAAEKLDFCRSLDNYLMMACHPKSATTPPGGDPIEDGTCPVNVSTVVHFCSGTEPHIESLPDGVRDETLSLHEKNYYLFRRRTLVSPVDNNIVKNLARIDVDVCWDKPGLEGWCPDIYSPPHLEAGQLITDSNPTFKPPSDPTRHCVDPDGAPYPQYAGKGESSPGANDGESGSCWCNSRVTSCVHLNMLRSSR